MVFKYFRSVRSNTYEPKIRISLMFSISKFKLESSTHKTYALTDSLAKVPSLNGWKPR